MLTKNKECGKLKNEMQAMSLFVKLETTPKTKRQPTHTIRLPSTKYQVPSANRPTHQHCTSIWTRPGRSLWQSILRICTCFPRFRQGQTITMTITIIITTATAQHTTGYTGKRPFDNWHRFGRENGRVIEFALIRSSKTKLNWALRWYFNPLFPYPRWYQSYFMTMCDIMGRIQFSIWCTGECSPDASWMAISQIFHFILNACPNVISIWSLLDISQ